MGIYDREYYRKEGPSYLASFTERGKVCLGLVIVNVVFYVLQLVSQNFADDLGWDGPAIARHARGGAVTDALILDVSRVSDGQVWRLLTYAFVHDPGTPWHLVFNMLFLWWFGGDVEDVYGRGEFLAFYLVAAFLGGLAFYLARVADIPYSGRLCLGASGAVTAVLVLCAIHFPSRVILVFWFLPVPIWLFVIVQVAQDLFGFLGAHRDATAYSVHLAGAAFGLVYYKAQWRLLNVFSGLKSWQKQRSRPRLRVYREEEHSQPVAALNVPPSAEVDEQLEAKLDAVLEKVARSGRDSLTDGEKQVLQRASEVYRKRRS